MGEFGPAAWQPADLDATLRAVQMVLGSGPLSSALLMRLVPLVSHPSLAKLGASECAATVLVNTAATLIAAEEMKKGSESARWRGERGSGGCVVASFPTTAATIDSTTLLDHHLIHHLLLLTTTTNSTESFLIITTESVLIITTESFL